MTTRILPKETVESMADQLVALGATREDSDAGIVVKAPNGKEALRAMVGTDGGFLTRWPDGLFDQA